MLLGLFTPGYGGALERDLVYKYIVRTSQKWGPEIVAMFGLLRPKLCGKIERELRLGVDGQ
eukprot:1868375-Pyramimonas_sp.AAC.1